MLLFLSLLSFLSSLYLSFLVLPPPKSCLPFLPIFFYLLNWLSLSPFSFVSLRLPISSISYPSLSHFLIFPFHSLLFLHFPILCLFSLLSLSHYCFVSVISLLSPPPPQRVSASPAEAKIRPLVPLSLNGKKTLKNMPESCLPIDTCRGDVSGGGGGGGGGKEEEEGKEGMGEK